MERLLTIGGYGYSKEGFFAQLARNNVDVLVDIRQRRGMRGPRYSFLNAKVLQDELRARQIAYIHLRDLAPSSDIREAQKRADLASGTGKVGRLRLSAAFADMYSKGVLEQLQISDVLQKLSRFKRPCLFCVEGPPEACHRSLVSAWIGREAKLEVVDILGP